MHAMLVSRHLFLAFALALASGLGRAADTTEAPLKGYESVEVAPSKTSIYLGYVSMTIPTF
ncbi:MAG TPA: hypothetical protein VGE76_16530, partial [Opitutaceae bacterium]